jgi:flagellar FliJ protein
MIKKFAFRLDQVLRHRANMLEMRERALAEVEAQLLRERKVLADLFALREDLLGEMAQMQTGPFASMERELYQQYLDWMAIEQERERRIIRELEALRDAKRAELVKASQDHRIVERLREREYEDYMIEVGRMEQGVLDEMAGNAYARGVRLYGETAR